MSPSCPTTDVGCMNAPMDMSGYLKSTIIPGGPIIMEDGFGTRLPDGHGSPMNLGAGVFLIMADGIGESVWDGIGFRPVIGDQRGFTGTLGMIISAGVR